MLVQRLLIRFLNHLFKFAIVLWNLVEFVGHVLVFKFKVLHLFYILYKPFFLMLKITDPDFILLICLKTNLVLFFDCHFGINEFIVSSFVVECESYIC